MAPNDNNTCGALRDELADPANVIEAWPPRGSTEKRYFMLENTFKEIITETRIKKVLRCKCRQCWPSGNMTTRVEDIYPNFTRLFAILVDLDLVWKIKFFMQHHREPFHNKELPRYEESPQDILPKNEISSEDWARFYRGQFKYLVQDIKWCKDYKQLWDLGSHEMLPFDAKSAQKIGEGKFGEVYGVHMPQQFSRPPGSLSRVGPFDFAVKVTSKKQPQDNRNDEIVRFLKLLKKPHPNVMELLAALHDGFGGGRFYLVFEQAHGTLEDFFAGRLTSVERREESVGNLGRLSFDTERDQYFHHFDSETLWREMANVVSALDHLHRLGICHMDLNPSNILVCAGQVLKITDFGQSELYRRTDFSVTTQEEPVKPLMEAWAPPEFYLRRFFRDLNKTRPNIKQAWDRAHDLWSLGCIVTEALVYDINKKPGSSPSEALGLFRKKRKGLGFHENGVLKDSVQRQLDDIEKYGLRGRPLGSIPDNFITKRIIPLLAILFAGDSRNPASIIWTDNDQEKFIKDTGDVNVGAFGRRSAAYASAQLKSYFEHIDAAAKPHPDNNSSISAEVKAVQGHNATNTVAQRYDTEIWDWSKPPPTSWEVSELLQGERLHSFEINGEVPGSTRSTKFLCAKLTSESEKLNEQDCFVCCIVGKDSEGYHYQDLGIVTEKDHGAGTPRLILKRARVDIFCFQPRADLCNVYTASIRPKINRTIRLLGANGDKCALEVQSVLTGLGRYTFSGPDSDPRRFLAAVTMRWKDKKLFQKSPRIECKKEPVILQLWTTKPVAPISDRASLLSSSSSGSSSSRRSSGISSTSSGSTAPSSPNLWTKIHSELVLFQENSMLSVEVTHNLNVVKVTARDNGSYSCELEAKDNVRQIYASFLEFKEGGLPLRFAERTGAKKLILESLLISFKTEDDFRDFERCLNGVQRLWRIQQKRQTKKD